jgi:GNAT superfamily N-acetyltransferase
VNLEKQSFEAKGIRISITDNDLEVGRAYIYLIQNDLHDRPFGLMEDVYVNESYRGKGIGSELAKKVIVINSSLPAVFLAPKFMNSIKNWDFLSMELNFGSICETRFS